jgi:hypothetical protein
MTSSAPFALLSFSLVKFRFVYIVTARMFLFLLLATCVFSTGYGPTHPFAAVPCLHSLLHGIVSFLSILK